METLLISQEQIRQLISAREIVDAVEKTFQGLGNGTVINPSKLTLDLGENGGYPNFAGYMNAMPAYVEWANTAGIKWAGGFLGERKKQGLPYITSMILLIDPRLGTFTAALDGAYITNMRTGAQTAIAMQYLLPKETKKVRLGIFGAGMQGRTQVMAIAQRFSIERLTVYDISPQAAHVYSENIQEYVQEPVRIAKTPREAAIGDAVITVTQSAEKFLQDEWVLPGTLVFPMGSYQECADDLILKSDKIIVDHMEQALHRGALAGLNSQGIITEENIFATIGELAAGKKNARISATERYICVPIGTGCLDIAVASIVLKKAQEQGIGGRFAFV